jgi:hypothetical protein
MATDGVNAGYACCRDVSSCIKRCQCLQGIKYLQHLVFDKQTVSKVVPEKIHYRCIIAKRKGPWFFPRSFESDFDWNIEIFVNWNIHSFITWASNSLSVLRTRTLDLSPACVLRWRIREWTNMNAIKSAESGKKKSIIVLHVHRHIQFQWTPEPSFQSVFSRPVIGNVLTP